ncbi:MAG: YesL family protein [Armatimonadota bacterium]
MSVFWKILRKSFVDSYDYLSLTIISSSLATGIALAILTVFRLTHIDRYPLILLIGVCILYIFLICPIIAGACVVSKKIVTHDDPSPRDIFSASREFLLPAWKLGLMQTIITVLLLVIIWFYFTHGGIVFKIAGIVFAYVMLFWLLSTIYHFPILIEQKPGVFIIIKRGFLLLMDNVGFTVSFFFVIILFAAICTATFVGLALLYLGVFSMLATRMTRVLFQKYGLIEPEVEPEIVDEGFPKIQ